MADYDYLYKVLLIGPEGSGKSSFLNRYTEDKFKAQYEPTIGVEFGARILQTINQMKVKLQIWDTSGNLDYLPITRNYQREARIILIAIDLTKAAKDNEDYLNQLSNTYSKSFNDPKIVKFLVGTKGDLPKAQANQAENLKMMDEFAQKNKGTNFHAFASATSANTGDNVKEAFEIPAQLFFDQEQARAQKQQQAEAEAAGNIITRDDIYQFNCFKDLNAALGLVQDDIRAYNQTREAPDQVKALNTSLEKLRYKLGTIYLQRVPSKIAKAIENGKPLTEKQQQQLKNIDGINTKDIATIGIEASKVTLYISNTLKDPNFKPKDANTLPPEIQQAAINIGKAMRNPVILKACAAFLIIALCITAGAVGGFFLGGVGSIPGAAIGTLLGIEITTTLLGTAAVAGALGAAGIRISGLFQPDLNNYQTMKQCGQELQKNAQSDPVPHPIFQV